MRYTGYTSYADALLSWNNVGTIKLIILIILLIIGNLIIFHSQVFAFFGYSEKPEQPVETRTEEELSKTQEMFKKLKKCTECLAHCNHNICKSLTATLRDTDYLNNGSSQPATCIFTGWELSHLIWHMFLGYFYNIYISVTLSVLFELFEHYTLNCASILDLFWNFIGLLIGVFIRYQFGAIY